MSLPNILFIMTDQQRADTIAALGNGLIYTPNMDRLVRRGVAFTQAYTSCPVCAPARYTILSGCDPVTTGLYTNECMERPERPSLELEKKCGPFLPRRLRELGYRTFGIGKFHTEPWDQDLGFETHLHSEELYFTPDQRSRDAYARFIREEHPEYGWLEMLQGERGDMYYTPQMSPLPAGLTVEAWAAAEAVKQIRAQSKAPYFGYVSFIGPHPPCAPPQPYNRMYNPDKMADPVRGDAAVDRADEQIQWMNHAVWADDVSPAQARQIKARYYGEITYIDACLGKILDAVEARPDADNTLICFFSDHGDHLGDHGAWQKESFFEAACRIPFLVSWPKQLPGNTRRKDNAGLTDLFGIAMKAAGQAETRDGGDVLDSTAQEQARFGYYGRPGTPQFKIMVRSGEWKYVFMANGGIEQLFNIGNDPHDLREVSAQNPAVLERLRNEAMKNAELRVLPFTPRPLKRICQMEQSRNVKGFPDKPGDLAKTIQF